MVPPCARTLMACWTEAGSWSMVTFFSAPRATPITTTAEARASVPTRVTFMMVLLPDSAHEGVLIILRSDVHCRPVERNRYAEHGPHAQRAVSGNRSLMSRRDRLCDRETQPRAAGFPRAVRIYPVE